MGIVKLTPRRKRKHNNKKEKVVFKAGMFPYEPLKEERYLRTIRGSCIVDVIDLDDKKKRFKGELTGRIIPDMSVDMLEVKQKKRRVYIPVDMIEKITKVR